MLVNLGFRPVREVSKTRTPYSLAWEDREFEVVIDEVVGPLGGDDIPRHHRNRRKLSLQRVEHARRVAGDRSALPHLD